MTGATLIGWMNDKYGPKGNGYACLWNGAFQTPGAICLWTVFFMWRRGGGDNFRYDAEEAVS